MAEAHTILSNLGAVWCMRMGCAAVRTETDLVGMGIVDAAGFGIKNGKKRGIVIEAKTSRSDFKRDAMKRHRSYGMEADAKRGWSDHYYIAPAGLLSADEMPDGWGLLEPDGEGIPRIIRRAVYTKPNDAWWAHHFATISKMMTNDWAHNALGVPKKQFIPKVIIPGAPDELAKALAPLKSTMDSIHVNGHKENFSA